MCRKGTGTGGGKGRGGDGGLVERVICIEKEEDRKGEKGARG